MKGSRDLASSPVRLPVDLKNWLKHKAIDNGRSFNSEVVMRLQESRQREEAAKNAA
ncbi:Arc family DNA-binding protein [Cupriavidus sp. USMAA2-4]|uniref:Arc family DNA-binding protein n=1 Tax=Cupriavidus sp. USMAA2-4 TaxID=876364 RepID=UPI000A000379|nr:Arc family DNA-binding protein [Cupriavidus sp. USMAA2-4]